MHVQTFYLNLRIIKHEDSKREEIVDNMTDGTMEPDQTTQGANDGTPRPMMRINAGKRVIEGDLIGRSINNAEVYDSDEVRHIERPLVNEDCKGGLNVGATGLGRGEDETE